MTNKIFINHLKHLLETRNLDKDSIHRINEGIEKLSRGYTVLFGDGEPKYIMI